MDGTNAHQVKDNWEIGLFRPGDAPGIVELYRAVYGDNYPIQEVYNPDVMIKQSLEETYRVVARTVSGEIVGHFALYRSSPPNKNLYESGQMIVRHDYRTSNMAFELAEYATQKVPQIYGIESVWGEAVCNHILTQIMSIEQGFYETALEVDLMPGESFAQAFEKNQQDSGRIATLVLFRIFQKRKQTIYVPPVYEEVLKFIYEGADSGHILLPGDAPLDIELKTKGEINLFAEAGVARLTFQELGGDFADVLDRLEQKALAGKAVVIQVFFPLTTPATGSVVDILRKCGYFLGGALPLWFDDDGMLMQKVTHIPNFAGINLYTERSKQLLEFIKTDWQENILQPHLKEETALPSVGIGDQNFSGCQQARSSDNALAEHEKYWLEVFADGVPALEMTTDFSRPSVRSQVGASVTGTIERELTGALNKFADENRTALFTVMLAGYMVLLAKYAGKEDVVVGVPFAEQVHPDVETTPGMLVNILALRGKPEEHKIFRQYLEEVKSQVINAQKNKEYSMEALVEKMGIHPDPSRHPLFDVLFDYSPKTIKRENWDSGLARKANFDFSLNIRNLDELLEVQVIYDSRLFRSDTIERLLKNYINIMSALVKNHELNLKDISFLDSEEMKILLDKFNDTYLPIPQDKVYIDLFVEQAEKTPDNIAVIDFQQRLTYSQLNHLTDCLAAYLVDLGVMPDSIVGIMMPRTADFVIGALAILKAGGAYLPISPDYPEGRIQHLITDSNIGILLTIGNLAEKAVGLAGIIIDLGSPDLFSYRGKKTRKVSHPSNLAYVIYTSGSTGKPKGVMISNANLINLCCWHNQEYQTTAEDVSALYLNTSFDASVFSIFPYLIKGSAVYIIPEDLLLDISGLNKKIKEYKATLIGLPTQFAETYMNSCENSLLKYMIVGGEKLISYKPRSYQLVNEYGPTEFTVCSTYFRVNENLDNIPIGKPVGNSWAYVLDKNGALQPLGVPGELCMAGLQLSRGYLNRPDLTAEKFVTNPYATGPENSRMYKTGDLVRWLPDGNLEYLGRIDMQVKIRGYRIEPGEIEQVLLSHNKITHAVVSVLQDNAGTSYLCSYYVSDEIIDDEELKPFISFQLPSYMVPTALIRIEKIPLTPNGKVDKRALPLPTIKVGLGKQRPFNELEENIAKVWRDVLGIQNFGVNDNFFNLGGTSLKAVSVITRLQQFYEVNINSLFEHQSLQEFAKHITQKQVI
ncbi:MAG: amino acid adenylation domain-containing protein [Syntrophomonas sp.]|nr:amino acid adenylation domain-containing protein [Syntrophomonas sp.]